MAHIYVCVCISSSVPFYAWKGGAFVGNGIIRNFLWSRDKSFTSSKADFHQVISTEFRHLAGALMEHILFPNENSNNNYTNLLFCFDSPKPVYVLTAICHQWSKWLASKNHCLIKFNPFSESNSISRSSLYLFSFKVYILELFDTFCKYF